jgi:hypothetical protein
MKTNCIKKIKKEEFDKTVELENELSKKIDELVWDIMKDEEEIALDFIVDTTHYKRMVNAGGWLYFYVDYTDEDGVVYEDEEHDFNEEPLPTKIMIFHQIAWTE